MKNTHIINLFSHTDTRYGFAIGKIRVLETKLLGKPQLENLLEAKDISGVLEILRQTEYGPVLKNLEDPLQWEEILQKYNKSIFLNLLKIVPEPHLVKLFLLKYDFYNLKILLKQKIFSISEEFINPCLIDWGTVPLKLLADSINRENFSQLPPRINTALKNIWREVSSNKTPQLIDILLDRWLYHTLYHESKGRCVFLQRLFSTRIDLYNMTIFFSAKKFEQKKEFFDRYFLHHGTINRYQFEKFYEDSVPDIIEKLVTTPYFEVVEFALSTWAEDRSLRKLDKTMDDFITKLLSRARLKSFGIEPVAAYIWAKEMELKNLRLIIIGIQYNLQPDWIREHLRRIYE